VLAKREFVQVEPELYVALQTENGYREG
jgi:hypothetical protein